MRISVFLLCFKVDLLNSDDHSSIYTYMYTSIRLPVKSYEDQNHRKIYTCKSMAIRHGIT